MGLNSNFSNIFHPFQSITTSPPPPNRNFLMKNQPLPQTPFLLTPLPPSEENNKYKIAENIINKKWMDLCAATALKETVLISFEYHSKASKQFLCSASWTKPYTYLGSFTNLHLALLVMPTILVRQGRIFFQGKTFHTNFVCCTKTNMLLNFRNMRNVDIRKFKNWNRNIRNVNY